MCVAGILPLYKPVGARSTGCVETVRRILGKNIKVGHGGTLDSTASGVLILLIGSATRLSSYVMNMPKRYETTIQLGSETTSDDESGDVTITKEWQGVNEKAIDICLNSFMGWRMQSPSAVSAIHVDGRRAHELVRSGHDIQIPARPVFFRSVVRTSGISKEGKVSFAVECCKGTYIRSFARDLGRALNTAAHVFELRRTDVGPFNVEKCINADEIREDKRTYVINGIMPIDSVCSASVCYKAGEAGSQRLANGQKLYADEITRINFSELSHDRTDSVILLSPTIFSVCRPLIEDCHMFFSPTVNILRNGANSQ